MQTLIGGVCGKCKRVNLHLMDVQIDMYKMIIRMIRL